MADPKNAAGTGDLVSVVIPTYNRAGRVRTAVDSALAQTYKNVEVVVVDDCSADGTADLLEEWYGGRIAVLRRTSNGGAAAARNTGIRAARGRWIRGLDSDDVMAPTAIADFVEAAARADDPERCLFFSDSWVVYEDDAGGERRVPAVSSAYNGADAIRAASGADWGTGLFFVARSAFERHGYFREDLRYAEDLEWVLRLLLLNGFAFHTVDKILLEYRQHEGNTIRANPEEVASCIDGVLAEVAEQLGPAEGGRLVREFKRANGPPARAGLLGRARRRADAIAKGRLVRLYLLYRGVGDGFAQ